jgi:hemerythrin
VADLNLVPMFQWTREYAVGVAEIDQEHQRLFALAEEMHQAMLAGKGKEVLKLLLADLLAYTDQHFAHEELLMKRIGYPQFREHQLQHQALHARVHALHDRAASGEITMTIEVAQFLVEWLKEHTTTSDRRIGEHSKAR